MALHEGFKTQFGWPDPPPLQDIEIEYGRSYSASLRAERERMIYLDGNSKENLTMADCWTWEDASRTANKCLNKCLPVIYQGFFEGSNKIIPKCHSPVDHFCMISATKDEVKNHSTFCNFFLSQYHFQFFSYILH